MTVFKKLSELIFHRNHCINCSEPLILTAYDRDDPEIHKSIKIDVCNNYVRLYREGHYEIRLDTEGYYQVYPSTLNIIDKLKHSKFNYSLMSLRKVCPSCNSQHIPKNLKHLLPGFRDITDLSFFEMLILFSPEYKRYSSSITKDINVFYEDDYLYIIDSMRYSSIITIKGPNYFFCESMPKVDLRDFKTLADLTSHFKILMAFS